MMASSQAQPMPQTIEAYKVLAQRDLELIEAQRREIGKLKAKVNKLEQKNESMTSFMRQAESLTREETARAWSRVQNAALINKGDK